MTFRLLLLLYNLLGLGVVVIFAGPVLCASRWRRGLAERLGISVPGRRPEEGEECVWVHGASVGEILAAAGLIEGLLAARPGRRLVLSCFTSSGRETARKRYGRYGDRITVTLLPLDWNGLPARILRRYRPSLFIILETELWPNLLHALNKMGCPLVLVNGRLSERSFSRYRFLKGFFGPLLTTFSLVCARTAADGSRFVRLGVPEGRLLVTGNVKHDRPSPGPPSAKVAAWRRRIEGVEGRAALVAGSLRSGESPVLLEAFVTLRASYPKLLFVLAPRHPEQFDETILDASGLRWVRWSEVGTEGPEEAVAVVLVDTLGDLADLYAVATVAFVGGTLGTWGGHNLMEPALQGVPVLFGPDYRSFEEEGKALIASGGGTVTADGASIVEKAEKFLAGRDVRAEAGRRALAAAEDSGGALEKTLTAIGGILGGDGR